MTGPFFSVIVPAHNSAEYMRKGLDSIADQDFRDFELIIICDDCDDSTSDIAATYMNRVPEITVIETKYGRAGMARNLGLKIARGKWILFMDDDDWYFPDAFQIIADELERQKDIDILAYGFEWKGMRTTYQRPGRVYPAIWNKAWRRDFIGEERFPDWIHTDDLGFARKMHPRARFGFLNMALYYYNFMRPGSVSDRIRNGEYDNRQFPEEVRDAAEGYERWLKQKGF